MVNDVDRLVCTNGTVFNDCSQGIMSPQRKGGHIVLVRIPSASVLLCFRALSFEPMDGF